MKKFTRILITCLLLCVLSIMLVACNGEKKEEKKEEKEPDPPDVVITVPEGTIDFDELWVNK